MHAALERLHVDVCKVDSPFSHDDDPVIAEHIRNARKAERAGINEIRYVLGKPAHSQKIDGAIASAICNEAAGDATTAEEWSTVRAVYMA